jgi:hypothetical protein
MNGNKIHGYTLDVRISERLPPRKPPTFQVERRSLPRRT